MFSDPNLLYRTIVNNCPQGVVLILPDSKRVAFANPAIIDFLGCEASDLLAREPSQLAELIHADDRDRFLEQLAHWSEGNFGSPQTEFRLLHKDHSWMWMQGLSAHIEIEGQSAVLLTIIDDTERHRAIDALRQNQTKLLQAQYVARIGDFTWEIDSGKVTWSEGMYRLLKYHPNEAIDLSRVNADIHHPEDLDQVNAWLNAGIKSGSEILKSNEYRLVCRDGDVLHVQTRGRFELENGRAVRLFGTCQDITERKRIEDALRESEQRLIAAQHLANLGDWWWDIRTGEVKWSEVVYQIFQRDPAKFTPRIDSILELSPWPEDHLRDQELIQRAIENRTAGSYEQRFLRPDGSTGYYASTFLGVHDDNGELIALKGTVQDITAHKQAEKEKAELQQQLHHAQKMESVGRLAGGVAHDFNNMLCAITSHTELALEEKNLSDDVRESLIEVRRAAYRAAGLTKQLLAFSRKQIIEPRVIDLSNLIQRLHPMLERLLGEDILLRTVPYPKLPPVKVDPGLVEQIVLNLAINARDAMPDGGELIIETSDVELDEAYCQRHVNVDAGTYALLAVSDTGTGITEEIREKIFEPFFTTKEMGQGTGLGLATVLGIVEQNRGRIEVYSELGQGTTFKIYFPTVSEQAQPLEAYDDPNNLDGNETVLVVEDEELVRSLAVQLLRRRGYKVLAVDSPEKAVTLAQQYDSTIDLLLTDVVMPKMNGRELATVICSQRPEMKVLFTSGYTENIIAHHGVLDQGLAFLSKPYSSITLATHVRKILDTPAVK